MGLFSSSEVIRILVGFFFLNIYIFNRETVMLGAAFHLVIVSAVRTPK